MPDAAQRALELTYADKSLAEARLRGKSGGGAGSRAETIRLFVEGCATFMKKSKGEQPVAVHALRRHGICHHTCTCRATSGRD